jgi:hypothetical protein
MHYTTINPRRLAAWPACLLLTITLAACAQTTNNPETGEPEGTPTNAPALEAAPTNTAVPSPTQTAVPHATAASLDEPFALAAGTETAVGSEGLSLRFDAVLEDSRCPTEVDCFWSGQAIIVIMATEAGQEPVKLESNTNPAPDQTVDELPAFGYTVRLIQLDPYPQTTDPIPFADYQAQLVVTRP